MAGVDQDALAAAMPWHENPFTVVDPGDTSARAQIPPAWWPILDCGSPAERSSAARTLWNNEFLALIPRFTQALDSHLLDVRVVQHAGLTAPALDYVFATDAGGREVWMGESPDTFGHHDPPLFSSLPAPVRTFLQRVHAGFTTWDGESCGLAPPTLMQTLASRRDDHGGQARIEWYETAHEPPTMQRLLRVTGRGPHADLFTSPDLPPGLAVTYFEPDFELRAFGEALDLFMMMPLQA